MKCQIRGIHMISQFKRFLLGRPMKSSELAAEKLNKVKALAVLSSDALSSVAYETEQILLVLVAVSTSTSTDAITMLFMKKVLLT